MRISVVLPQPLGPMIEMNSPGSAQKLTDCKTSSGRAPARPGKIFETRSTASAAGMGVLSWNPEGVAFPTALYCFRLIKLESTKQIPRQGRTVQRPAPSLHPSCEAASGRIIRR
jgi:hypothetical protein